MNRMKNVIIVFKQHRISTFVTADLITKELKSVVILRVLWLLLQAISVDGLPTTSLFNFVEFLKNTVDMEFLLFTFSIFLLPFEWL